MERQECSQKEFRNLNETRSEALLSVVIVSWNVAESLRACLSSVIGSSSGLNPEIIVVDNNSSDDSCKICREMHPQVRLISLKENFGFAKANNIAIKDCNSKYILLLNPDATIQTDAIHSLLEFIEANEKVGAIGPKIIESSGKVQGSARKFPSLRTAFLGRTSILQKLLRKSKAAQDEIPCLSHNSSKPLEVEWVSGACMMVRRETIEQVGLLDEKFFMYWEDADWCYRMKRHGWKIFWVPAAKITHNTGQSSSKSRSRTIIAFHKSIYYYFEKNINEKNNPFLSALIFTLISARCLLTLVKSEIISPIRNTAKKQQ